MSNINPVKSTERFIILDVLRGIALLGICLANYPEFSLYTFQKNEVIAALPTSGIDRIIRYLQYIFIDGKFYTLFSLLFGIGFSIILSNARQKNRNGLKVFYRRMIILVLIGFSHLLLLWAGDILILYALLGLFLPLFRNLSDKKLLTCSVLLLLTPVVVDTLTAVFGWNLAAPAVNATQYFHNRGGITEDNFPVWLVEKDHYLDVLKFNLAGSFIRMQEFIEGNRFFKVLGIFLLGLYIGRHRMYSGMEEHKILLKKVCLYGFTIGFPISVLYAWSAMNGYPLGLTGHSVMYALSVVPLSLAYTASICLLFMNNKHWNIFKILAAPGRMALTNYIGQSALGMYLFYGIGLGLGATVGLVYVEFTAAGIFMLQVIFSGIWLSYFRFGPLEWIWRMMTYGKWLTLTKKLKRNRELADT